MDGASFGYNEFTEITHSKQETQSYGMFIYVPVIVVCCIIFSSLALGLTWLNMEVNYDFSDPDIDDLNVEFEDSLGEREIYVRSGGDFEKTTESNEDLEEGGYEDAVAQKITLKVLTIIMISFSGIALILSLIAFTNNLPLMKVLSVIVWITIVLSVAQVIIFAAFYNPFAGSAESDDDSDSDISCDEGQDESSFLNVYGKATGNCEIVGESASVEVTYHAGAAFWFAFVKMLLILLTGFFCISQTRKISRISGQSVKILQRF